MNLCANLKLALARFFEPAADGPFGNHATLTDDLVSYWSLDEVSGVRYDSVVASANDLTDNNTVGASLYGPTGTVASFVAASTESLTTAAALTATTDFTVAVWVSLDDLVPGGDLDIATRWNNGTFAYDWQIKQAAFTGNVYAVIQDSVAGSGDSFHTVTDAGWHLFVMSYNATTKVASLYMDNGAAANTEALTNALKSAGNQHRFAADGLRANQGVWSRIITADERTSVFNSGNGKAYADLTTAEKVGLVSYWNLDEASGTRADSHGSNDLTDNNTVGSATATAGAMHNVAASFVAANNESLSVADAGNEFSIPATGGTLAFWFNPAALAGLRYLGGKTDTASLDEYQIYTNGANLTFQVELSGGGYSIPVKAATASVWQLAILWYDPSAAKCFVQINDGTPGEAAAASAPTANQGHDFEIGRISASASNYEGLIDEYGFWSRVLTAQERTDLYNAGAGLFFGS